MVEPLQLVTPMKQNLPLLMTAEQYYERFQRTLDEWRKFINGETKIDTAIVSADTIDSWIRCRQNGVDPVGRRVPMIIDGAELHTLMDDNEELIELSRPVLRNLFQFVQGLGVLVTLFDKNGYLLEVIGDSKFKFWGIGIWQVGSSFNERFLGNNSVGTAVVLKRPIQVFGPQHYFRGAHNLMGSGAPIFSPDGSLLGGVSLIARYYHASPHIFGMAVAAAQAIENELRTNSALIDCKKAFSDREVSYSYQKAVISSIPEALIAIDRGGIITMINENARKMFDLNGASIEGRLLRNVFGEENSDFFDMIEKEEALTDIDVRLWIKGTVNDYTLVCNPIYSQERVIGKIIILNEIKRAKSMVTRMIGAKAKYQFEDIYGKNPVFLKAIDQARLIARSNSNILLLGESGTGKDILAQSIHNASHHKNGPYVAINCAAIPRDLITSELFGYSEGAFTGSRRGGNQGKFELADGGTIFLDEIAETPLELQSVLLRVIEEKSVTRIGGTRVRPIDVRIITATNKDLMKEVNRGTFRKDLYYRLNVFVIHLVPLSQRKDDIPLLVNLFIKKYESLMRKKIRKIDDQVIETFMCYPWPGNVRELQNVIERMMYLADTDVINAGLIPEEIVPDAKSHETINYADISVSTESEKEMIAKMLKLRLCKTRIAEELKMGRATLYRKIKKYNLENGLRS